jgi:hypothetical protein
MVGRFGGCGLLKVLVAGSLAAVGPAALAAVIPGTALTPGVWWAADAAGNTTSGASLTKLVDLSGNGNDALPSGTSPALVAGVVNGKPVIRTNGSTDSMISPTGAATGNAAHTIIVVTKFTSASGFAGGAVLYSGTAGANQNSTIGAQQDSRLWVGGYAQDDNTPYSNASGAPAGSQLGTANFHVIDKLYNNGNFQGYLDGNQVINGAGATYNLGNSETGIGRQFDTGTYYAGDIAEVVIFNSALSASDRQAVESYLGTKYAVTVPEPGAFAVLAVGGGAVLSGRRRRRA